MYAYGLGVDVIVDLSNLAGALKFTSSAADIRNNRLILDAVRRQLNEANNMVNGFRQAAQAMCAHAKKVSYSDPRDSGWDCPDCGASR